MKTMVKDRLPCLTAEEKALLKGSFDFIGINYYTATYAKNAPSAGVKNPSYSTDSYVNSTGNHPIPFIIERELLLKSF